MAERQALELCRQIPAFRRLNEGECRQLLGIAQQRSFAPGDKVLEQGQRSQFLWILLDGQCEVVKASVHNGPVVLAELEPFQIFGEMSFFSPAPHSASVVAKTPVRLLAIARSDYDDLITEGSEAAYKLAYNVVESLAHRLRRMDDRIAELDGHEQEITSPQPEWSRFREKLFGDWNL
jgi:CRP-like cAMP-binding protein